MDVGRRSLLKGLATGVTGAVVAPASPAAQPQTGTTQRPDATSVVPAAGLLDPHQRATLASLADIILPGSVAAGTIDRIDSVAAVDAPAAQRRLLNAIARFDQEAREASAGRWLDLSDPARVAILTRAAEGAPGRRPQPAWTRAQPVAPPDAATDAATTLRDHLDVLKGVIGPAFASTEAGMKVLGWTGGSSWRELPGCTGATAPRE